jgi:hypothetical protein
MVQTSRAEQLEQIRTYWKLLFVSWLESGLSLFVYCRRHNLKHHQLVYWKKRFLKIETGVSFVPVKLDDFLDLPTQSDCAALCLVINNHLKIEIRAGFDPQLLRQLIFALRGLA